MSKRIGFTLIELLVVIAIIAILAAILFPVFAKVREKARQTACLSNVKQLTLGFMQYQQDFDEMSPPGISHTYSLKGWAGQIYPYVKSAGVFVCPSDSSAKASCSYCYNRNLLSSYDSTTRAVTTYPVAAFGAPAKTVLLCEISGSGGYNIASTDPSDPLSDMYNAGNSSIEAGYSPDGVGGVLDYEPYTTPISPTNQVCGELATCTPGFTLKYATGYMANTTAASQVIFDKPLGRHTDGSNFVMADGHAKWFRGASVSNGNNNQNEGECGSAPTASNTGCAANAATFSIY